MQADTSAGQGGLLPGEATKARPSAGTLVWWLIALIILADQVTKLIVQRYIPLFDTVTVVPGMVDLVHIHNAGVAFGLMNDMTHPFRSALTTTLALAALAGIVYYARQIRPEERLARTGLSLILGGAVGNLIDRVRLGHVVDFIDVYRGDWHFWAFNVADAAISCGAALIFIELFFSGRHASHSV
jgi:signal peptidase II